jgi:RNA polymerase sigma-70 factor, ECF subfamily
MSKARAGGSAKEGPVLRLLPGGARADPPFDMDAVARRYAPYIAAIALKLLGRDGEIDDVVQDVLVEVHRGLGQLRDPGALKAWLGQLTVRSARRRLRRSSLRRWLRPQPDQDYENLADAGASPEERAMVRSAYRLLARMPVNERVVWVLRQVEGQTLEQIAEHCSCSLSTAQRRLRAARAFMEKANRP